jgi:guanylate kinase
MLPPKLSDEARSAAGMKAVKARQDRATVKQSISSGALSFFDLFNDERECIQRMRLFDALNCVPGVGEKRVNLIFERTGISRSRRIGGVGKKQRDLLREEFLLMKTAPMPGKLLVVSGPSGVGKSTITNALKDFDNFWVSISATTRAMRQGEVDGKDYLFVTDQDFNEMVENNALLEWAEFTGAKYGTPAMPVTKALDKGLNVVLEIELNGARQIRKKMKNAVLVFIEPPSWTELESRLMNRGTESSQSLEMRLNKAKEELKAASEFDFVLVNTKVEQVVQELVSLALR